MDFARAVSPTECSEGAASGSPATADDEDDRTEAPVLVRFIDDVRICEYELSEEERDLKMDSAERVRRMSHVRRDERRYGRDRIMDGDENDTFFNDEYDDDQLDAGNFIAAREGDEYDNGDESDGDSDAELDRLQVGTVESDGDSDAELDRLQVGTVDDVAIASTTLVRRRPLGAAGHGTSMWRRDDSKKQRSRLDYGDFGDNDSDADDELQDEDRPVKRARPSLMPQELWIKRRRFHSDFSRLDALTRAAEV